VALCFILLFVSVGAMSACSRSRSGERFSVPQIDGSIAVNGVQAPVRVVRDQWGVPHIYAANQDDLFFAQGFVQAQDRLFQMDLWRRAAQGRLSEVLGANFIERDAMTRRIQYRGDPEAEWASYGPDARGIAEAFVRGINAWIDRLGDHLPQEFALAGWRPEHWRATDLWNRTDAFLDGANAIDEVFRARLAAAIGPRDADRLTSSPSTTRLDIPRELDVKTIAYVIADALKEIGTPPFFSGLAAPLSTKRLADDPTIRVEADALTYYRPAPGSNAWAVDAAHSATGSPLFAADPHRTLDHPSFRYVVHLNAPGWNVIGATAPWHPGVAIGHNDRVAWAMTSRAADVQDVYVEKLNPANPHRVQHGGKWIDTAIVSDPIFFKGKTKPFAFERESTTHGVIIASDRERHLAFTIQWIGFEPGTAPEPGALAVDRAGNDTELRAALDRWKAPAATFVYATRDDRIGTALAGWIPNRRGWNGTTPAPGWTGTYEWQGVSADTHATSAASSSSAFVVSANDSVPRTERINEVLSSAATFSEDDFKRLQHDTVAWNAGRLLPLLDNVRIERADVEKARDGLKRWNQKIDADSSEAALYVLWEQSLLRRLVASEKIEASLAEEFVSHGSHLLVPAMTDPRSPWFSGTRAGDRGAIIAAALGDAVDRFAEQQSRGQTPRWGTLHTALFRHPLAVTTAARKRYSVGPFDRPGYRDTVMSTGGSPLEQTTGATFSMIADLADWDRSVATNAPGQAEWPASDHFADLAKGWAAGEYFSLPFSDAAVQKSSAATLTLTPQPERKQN